MLDSLILAVQSTVPQTPAWNPQIGLIITGSCLLVLFIASRTIAYPKAGPKMPLPFPSLFNDPSIGTFLGSMSLGHIVGVGAVLGLTNVGLL